MKIFSPAAAGFIPGLALRQKELAAATASGARPEAIAKLENAITNLYVDITVTALFLCMVAIIVTGCAIEWFRLIRGRKPIQLREGPYIALPETEPA
jgi:hypothetical protein